MLLQTAHTKRVEAAKAVGIDLKQTFAKEGQASASKASGDAHARQCKRMRAAQHGRSTEAEVRALLEEAVKPQGRLKLGSRLADIGRKIKLTDEEVALIHQRDESAPRLVDLE